MNLNVVTMCYLRAVHGCTQLCNKASAQTSELQYQFNVMDENQLCLQMEKTNDKLFFFFSLLCLSLSCQYKSAGSPHVKRSLSDSKRHPEMVLFGLVVVRLLDLYMSVFGLCYLSHQCASSGEREREEGERGLMH